MLAFASSPGWNIGPERKKHITDDNFFALYFLLYYDFCFLFFRFCHLQVPFKGQTTQTESNIDYFHFMTNDTLRLFVCLAVFSLCVLSLLVVYFCFFSFLLLCGNSCERWVLCVVDTNSQCQTTLPGLVLRHVFCLLKHQHMAFSWQGINE